MSWVYKNLKLYRISKEKKRYQLNILWISLLNFNNIKKFSNVNFSKTKSVNKISYVLPMAEKWNSCAVFLRVDAYVMHNIIITVHCRQWIPIRYFKLIYCHVFLLFRSSKSLIYRQFVVQKIACAYANFCTSYKMEMVSFMSWKRGKHDNFACLKTAQLNATEKIMRRYVELKRIVWKNSQKRMINLNWNRYWKIIIVSTK